MSNLIIGIDIGGTKTAVVLGLTTSDGKVPSVLEKVEFPTETEAGPEQAIARIENAVQSILKKQKKETIGGIGISCGGPLDSQNGLILSPPNLPGWDSIPIVNRLEAKFGLPVGIQNDANACALAEWKWGAGKGTRNMIFLTFGTGLGAGLILNGKLYSGTSGMAGEVGHIRLEKDGPEGYGKAGSFEGFCSGGGIAQLAKEIIGSSNRKDTSLAIGFPEGKNITAKDVCEAASKGDPGAVEILKVSGRHLGMGLSILIDILNPERIVIGSVYARCHEHLYPFAAELINRESLSASRNVCSVLPSALGENIGDYGSLSVALLSI